MNWCDGEIYDIEIAWFYVALYLNKSLEYSYLISLEKLATPVFLSVWAFSKHGFAIQNLILRNKTQFHLP